MVRKIVHDFRHRVPDCQLLVRGQLAMGCISLRQRQCLHRHAVVVGGEWLLF